MVEAASETQPGKDPDHPVIHSFRRPGQGAEKQQPAKRQKDFIPSITFWGSDGGPDLLRFHGVHWRLRYKSRTIGKLKHLQERFQNRPDGGNYFLPITSYPTWSLRTTHEKDQEDQED